jgi:serine/threonine protein kinase
MAARGRVKYLVLNSTTPRMTTVLRGQTVREVIALVAQADGADVDQVSLDGCLLDQNKPFDDFYDSAIQLFVFSKSTRATGGLSRTIPARPGFTLPPLRPPPTPKAVSWCAQDFDGLRELRVVGRGPFGVVKLFEDPVTHEKTAIKSFNREAARDASLHELEQFSVLRHQCVLRTVGFCPATETSPAQLGAEFAAGGSLRAAMGRLDDTGKAIVACGIVVGMKFLHSQGVVHCDLKPENIMLDDHGLVKIGDLGNSRFCDLRLTFTMQTGAPLYMAPDVSDTPEADVYSFALILYELLVGEAVFPPTTPLRVLVARARKGDRPELPTAMDAAARRIIKQGWSVDPELRGSFHGIFDSLRRIGFRLTPAVDANKVAQYLALLNSQAPVTPPRAARSPRHVEWRAAAAPTKLTAPPVIPPKGRRQFPLLHWQKTVTQPRQRNVEVEVPDGIIAHLTRECGGNVDECNVVSVTSSKCWDDHPRRAARNIVNLEDCSEFLSAYRDKADDIPHTRNNWVCYDFKERRIVPTHYTIRTTQYGPHLRAWVVETSADAENWQEVDHKEDSGWWVSRTFAVVAAAAARFIRLVQVGRNHRGDDRLVIEAWEIFGSLIE